MRFISTVTSILLTGASISGFVSAHPSDIEGQLDSRSPELNFLDARLLNLKVAEEPKKPSTCPATNNGPGRVYPGHKYTTNQIKAAFMGGATLAADGKQVGDNKYPHDFGNSEKLPFPYGRDKMEFPIQTNNEVYNGGPVNNVPDRVVFEYRKSKTEMTVKYCGVMRLGPGVACLNCPE